MSQPLPPGAPNDAHEATGVVKDLAHRYSGRSELGACRIEVVHDTLKPWRGAEGGGGDTGAEGDGTR
jgi:hypothetical protein